MTVCILGNSLTALTLAKALVNHEIEVDLYFNKKNYKISDSRTIGIANNNVDFVQSKGEGLIIFAVNYNILRFTQGKADLLYHRHHISQKNLYYGV